MFPFIKVLTLIFLASPNVCGSPSRIDYDLTKTNALLERFQHEDAGYTSIKEQDFREALDNCVKAVRSDALNQGHSKKLLDILQLVTDDRQRFLFYVDVVEALLKAEKENIYMMREAAGLLGANLADAMDRYDKREGNSLVQDMFFRHSSRIFPESPVAARCLGYKLEQQGKELEAMEVYREALARTRVERLDLRLLLASCCSPFLDDGEQGDMRFSRVSAEIRSLVNDIQTAATPHRNVPSPVRDLVYIPSFSWPYLGRTMRPLMEDLCWILAAMTAGLHEATTGLHPQIGWGNYPIGRPADETHQDSPHTEMSAISRKPGKEGRITLGVVMERRGNDSPHRLIRGVLEDLDRTKFIIIVFSRDYVADYSAAGQAVVRAANEVVIFPWHPFVTGLADPFADRRLIAKAQVDVLLYVALGNTLWSHLLALGRLAPVQISFGHGHPVTSGSPGIDYFVSSVLFETAASINGKETRRMAGTTNMFSTSADKVAADDDDVDIGETGDVHGDGVQDYTEQLVLFDSLTASLPEEEALAYSSSSAVASVLAAVRHSSPTWEASLQEGDNLYHCIQHSKKFHPDFDPVLRGVLQSDPAAKILLSTQSEVHLPRWKRALGSDLTRRLVFLPYMPHPEMLTVVANCRVMLDTFPWGAGVTSMEALLVGLPVVTLPARISVLPLASGQLAELGVQDELVASDVVDMVTKAVKVASVPAHKNALSDAILQGKHRLSNPYHAVKEWGEFLERAARSAIRPDANV